MSKWKYPADMPWRDAKADGWIVRRVYYHPARYLEGVFDDDRIAEYIECIPCLQEHWSIPNAVRDGMFDVFDAHAEEVDLVVWDDLKEVAWADRHQLLGDGWV
jgi:hypothetical protein